MDPSEKKVDWGQMDDEEHSEGEEQVETTQEGDKTKSDPSKPYVPKTGPRRGGRGGSRGSYNKDGRGSRGGFGGGQGRGGYRSGEGRPNYGEQQGERPAYDRPKREKENEPKEEMIAKLNKLSDQDLAHIYLYDVDYKASLEDIKNCYADVAIIKIEKTGSGGGAYLLEMTKRNALEMVELGPKSINNRPFYMKIGYKQKKPEEQWHTVGAQPQEGFNKGFGYNNKPYGGYNKPQGDRPYKPYKKPEGQEGQTEETSEDNKFFKRNSDQTAGPVKFTKNTSKDEGAPKEEGEVKKSEAKPNPFGDAKPVDEAEYLKKKEEEKKDAPVEKTEQVTTTTNNAPPGMSKPPGIKVKEQAPEEKKAGEEATTGDKPRPQKNYGDKPRGNHNSGPRNNQGGKPGYNKPKPQMPVIQADPIAEKKKAEEKKIRMNNPFAGMNDDDDD